MNAANLTLSLVIGVLFGGGTYLITQRALLRVILGFTLLGHAANLILLLAGGPAGPAPDAAHIPPDDPPRTADPLPQALALTAVVITFAVTALLLALAHRGVVLNGDDEVPDDVEDRQLGRRPMRERELETGEEDL